MLCFCARCGERLGVPAWSPDVTVGLRKKPLLKRVNKIHHNILTASVLQMFALMMDDIGGMLFDSVEPLNIHQKPSVLRLQ